MDCDRRAVEVQGPHSLQGASWPSARSLPSLREPPVDVWGPGPWDFVDFVDLIDAPPSQPSQSSAWTSLASSATAAFPAGTAGTAHTVLEDLYPDDLATPGTLYEPGADLSTTTTYQYELQSDTLLPDDSFTQPPPDYPLFNWTLPYGPDNESLDVAVPSPGPPGHPGPTGYTHPASGGGGGGAPVRRSAVGQGFQAYQGYQGSSAPPLPAPAPAPALLAAAASESRHQFGLQPVHQILDDEDVVEVEVGHQGDGSSGSSSSERVVFDNIEDALASIEGLDLVQHQRQHQYSPQTLPRGSSGPGPLLSDEKEEEVIKAAKSLFSKRTRTLYHWLFPDTSKTKLKATVSAAWDTLADTEKQFYLSQVLGRFGLQATELMVNPQLDGLKALPYVPLPVLTPLAAEWQRQEAGLGAGHVGVGARHRVDRPAPRASGHAGHAGHAAPTRGMPTAATSVAPRLSEADEAVNQLFASCEDSETWTSYSLSSSSNATSSSSGRHRIL